MADYEAARAYAQVILDGVSAHEGGTDLGGELMNLAIQRALEVDAIQVTVSDDDPGDDLNVVVDASAAIGGTLILVRGLITRIRELSGLDDDQIIADARERVDLHCHP